MSVGLDIGSKTIKVVELDKNGSSFYLKSSGVIGYRGYNVEKLSDEDVLALAGIISKLFKSAGVSGRDVAISLPESLVFTRTISLPLLTDREVAAAIKWEAESYIPIPIRDAIVQHMILERNEAGPSPRVQVLLVAAPRILVEKYVNVAQKAKLNVIAAETELLSLVRSLSPAQGTSLIIDFGARSVDVAITRGQSLAFSRSIPTGGEALTRALTQSLNVSMQEAEEYKRVYGLSSRQLEGKIRQALLPVVTGILEEVKKAIHFYQSEEKGEVPTSIILSGGVAGMPELISYITQVLGTEILIANPFSKIEVPENTRSQIAPYAPLYSVAVGLAMR